MSDQSDEDILQLYAIVGFQNFMLELLLAGEMASTPDGKERLELISQEILQRIRYKTTVPRPTDLETQADMQARMLVVASRFFVRAEERRADIVRQQSTDQG